MAFLVLMLGSQDEGGLIAGLGGTADRRPQQFLVGDAVELGGGDDSLFNRLDRLVADMVEDQIDHLFVVTLAGLGDQAHAQLLLRLPGQVVEVQLAGRIARFVPTVYRGDLGVGKTEADQIILGHIDFALLQAGAQGGEPGHLADHLGELGGALQTGIVGQGGIFLTLEKVAHYWRGSHCEVDICDKAQNRRPRDSWTSKQLGTPTKLIIVAVWMGEPGVTKSDTALGMLPDLLGYNLRRAQVVVFQDFMKSLKALNLTPGQFGVLQIVKANPGLKQTDLANALNVDRSTVVGVIDRLQGRGLLRRVRTENDRRSYALHLTDVGRDSLRKAERDVLRHEDRIADRLDAEERQALIGLLRKLIV